MYISYCSLLQHTIVNLIDCSLKCLGLTGKTVLNHTLYIHSGQCCTERHLSVKLGDMKTRRCQIKCERDDMIRTTPAHLLRKDK